MLDKKFPHIYVINREARTDRAKAVHEQFERIGCAYNLHKAIDGYTLDIKIEQTPAKRWNTGAYALALTTIKILEEAIEKGYESILICEDDLGFHPIIDLHLEKYLAFIPNYDLLFFGYTPTIAPTPANCYWVKLYGAFSCHCYAVNKHIMPTYKKLLERLDNPIDVYTNIIIASRQNSYGAMPLGNEKLAHQVKGFSDIERAEYDTIFTY